MGKIDILQFCHRRFNNSFFFCSEIQNSHDVFCADLVTIPSLKKWMMSASGSAQGWGLTDLAANLKTCWRCDGFGSEI